MPAEPPSPVITGSAALAFRKHIEVKAGDHPYLCQQVEAAEHAGRVTYYARHDRTVGGGASVSLCQCRAAACLQCGRSGQFHLTLPTTPVIVCRAPPLGESKPGQSQDLSGAFSSAASHEPDAPL